MLSLPEICYEDTTSTISMSTISTSTISTISTISNKFILEHQLFLYKQISEPNTYGFGRMSAMNTDISYELWCVNSAKIVYFCTGA